MKKIKYKILGDDWTINFIPKDNPVLTVIVTGDSWYGICESTTFNIYIDEELNKQYEKLTLTHELTHAYLGKTLNDKKQYDQEFICDFLAQYGVAISKDAANILKLKRKKIK